MIKYIYLNKPKEDGYLQANLTQPNKTYLVISVCTHVISESYFMKFGMDVMLQLTTQNSYLTSKSR
jgi:hypothetical protein